MRLLVPVDGSAAAQHAVRHALWLAHDRAEAVIVLLNVQSRETLDLSEIRAEAGDERAIAASRSTKALRNAIRACEESGVRFETRAEFGPIPETIVRTAKMVHADQIVMGTRGLGEVGSLVLGSVALHVVHKARMPVTLVKKTSRPEQQRKIGD